VISNFSNSFTREGTALLTAKVFVWATNPENAYQKAWEDLQLMARFHGFDAPVESHDVHLIYLGFWEVRFATDGSLGTPEEDEGHQRDYPLTD